MGKHGLAGDVTDTVDPLIVGATTIIDGDDASLVRSHAGRLEAQPLRLRAPAHGNQHAVEQQRLVAQPDLDATARLAEARHPGFQEDAREQLLAATRERLDEIAI